MPQRRLAMPASSGAHTRRTPERARHARPFAHERQEFEGFDSDRLAEIIDGARLPHRVTDPTPRGQRWTVVREHVVIPRTPPAPEGVMAPLAAGPCAVISGDYSMGILAAGAVDTQTVCLGITLKAPVPVLAQGRRALAGDVQTCAEGGEIVYKAAPGSAWGAIVVSRADFDALSRVMIGCDAPVPARGSTNTHPISARSDAVRRGFDRVFGLSGVSAPLGDDPGVAAAERERLLCAMLLALAEPSGAGTPGEPPTGRRRAVARRVRDLMEAGLDRPFSLPALCAHTGLSARTLQITFRGVYGVTPRRWFILERLHRVRADLLAGRTSGSDSPVTAAAVRWGFSHFGHFAAEYRAVFGEPPSRTAVSSDVAARRPASRALRARTTAS